ncbi:MAG: 1-acyl-sn-glycerol-3-phosphate acyltransferase [Acidimicrobiia bacterium]|nr:1-acyl-sn-glycerol-3-phosphate acyltransferase [Acidimicrobiia bacterium]MCL4292659.1 1-acyl-sn-glycerol-3-phosphate acyltransferase [Acidimicrobiia bacterium]
MTLYRAVHTVVSFLARLVFRVRVEGADRLPPAGPYVIAPSHRSILDSPFTGMVTRRRVRFMAKKELWDNKLVGRLIEMVGGFPVDRSHGSGAVKAALAVLAEGEPVVVFPEGTRRRGPVIEDLHEGAAYLAVKTGVPVVPVGVGGSEAILPSGASIPRFKRVAVLVGEPIEPRPGPSPSRTVDRTEVHRITEELERSIQELFTEAEARAAGRSPSRA